MSESWKPSVRIWAFADAPEEFRGLSPFGDKSECVIYAPPELVALFDDWELLMPVALWFLNTEPKPGRVSQYAGDDWGLYSWHRLPSGGVVAVTTDCYKDRYGPRS